MNGRRLLSIYVAPRDSQITPDLLSAHWWSLLSTDSSDTVQDTLFIREDILRPIIDTLQEMLLRYCRVHILRFDLHVPEFMPDNKIMSNFQRMLFKRIRHHYGIKSIGFIWVREQEKAKSQHYHCAIYLDGNKTRHPGLIQDWIAMIWEQLDGSSRHWSGYHNLRRADEEAIDKAVFHLSYLAKTRGKGFRPPQTKDYGWTRSICASERPLSNAKEEA